MTAGNALKWEMAIDMAVSLIVSNRIWPVILLSRAQNKTGRAPCRVVLFARSFPGQIGSCDYDLKLTSCRRLLSDTAFCGYRDFTEMASYLTTAPRHIVAIDISKMISSRTA
ncbi:hypothetical protein E4T39_02292 [Aureobasidium subglaciale]|nr:hypothetical protein E4T39_02292 [Aureobasidium subglaciale]